MEKINTLLMGTGSIALIEQTPEFVINTNLDIPQITQTIIQLIVAIATIFGMFKKSKTSKQL